MDFNIECTVGKAPRFYINGNQVSEDEYWQVKIGKGTTKDQIMQKSKLDFLNWLLEDIDSK